MRLAASLLVLWSHQFVLTGLVQPEIPWIGSYGTFAVLVFFAISGYLNAQSLFRSRSVCTFLISRVFRIFPALIVCVVFCIAMGACVTTQQIHHYFAPENTRLLETGTPLSFFIRNSTLLWNVEYKLPGVFKTNSYPDAVNGSLWTLPHEVKLYLLLAAAGFCCHFKPWLGGGVAVAAIAGLALFGMLHPLGPLLRDQWLATFAVIFGVGAGLAWIEACCGLKVAVVVFSILFAAFGLFGNPTTAAFVAIAVGCVLLNQVRTPAWLAPRLDISYGIYLYAFPIQQLTSNASGGFWVRFGLAVTLTVFLAIFSAKFVERPLLAWRKTFQSERAPSIVGP
ncbi:acyltransferase [Bradyrhizobium sp.]|uniref:acyltransferase family protein n=1 Tax=Bradyrhizobium sp. TaxID=376 RepID=UPI0025BC1100|nr:acyltransferase [Bradyrhizobium sp.]